MFDVEAAARHPQASSGFVRLARHTEELAHDVDTPSPRLPWPGQRRAKRSRRRRCGLPGRRERTSADMCRILLPFNGQAARGLGPTVGAGAAAVAMLAYNAIIGRPAANTMPPRRTVSPSSWPRCEKV